MRRSIRVTAHLAVGVAVSLAVAVAEAAPIAHCSWDRCEPFVRNRDSEGPGVYTQTLSITGVHAGTTLLVFSVDLNVAVLTFPAASCMTCGGHRFAFWSAPVSRARAR